MGAVRGIGSKTLRRRGVGGQSKMQSLRLHGSEANVFDPTDNPNTSWSIKDRSGLYRLLCLGAFFLRLLVV